MEAKQRWGHWGQPTAVRKARWLSVMRWRRSVQRVLRPYKLSFTQWLVLDATQHVRVEKGDAVSQSDVGAHLGLSRATVSDAMCVLANEGLVDRGPDIHMPAWRIIMTDKGRDLLHRVGLGIDAVSRLED